MKKYVLLFEEYTNGETIKEGTESKADYEERRRLGQRRVDTKEKSLASRLKEMADTVDLNRITPQDLKKQVLDIINDPNTHASERTRSKWRLTFERQHSIPNMLKTIYNIILKAGGLGVY